MSGRPYDEPAFPAGIPIGQQQLHGSMTLRDWLAGQAMPAVLTLFLTGKISSIDGEEGDAMVARVSYQAADAMLAERVK